VRGCKNCKKTQLHLYAKRAYRASINSDIAVHVKEGCGIRSIARLLNISAGTVLSRIKTIAGDIKKPSISIGKVYEVDELKTYIKKKTNDYWVIYAIDMESKQVVDYKTVKRTKKNIKRVTPHVRGWQNAHKFIPMALIFTGLLFPKRYIA
jgi:insertion element IS1 protein InsB